MLGKYSKNARNFELIEFRDAYDKECSLQQSSIIGEYDDAYDRPGSSCVWLGRDPDPADTQSSTRMHLNREQVADLVDQLQCWLDTGAFAPFSRRLNQ